MSKRTRMARVLAVGAVLGLVLCWGLYILANRARDAGMAAARPDSAIPAAQTGSSRPLSPSARHAPSRENGIPAEGRLAFSPSLSVGEFAHARPVPEPATEPVRMRMDRLRQAMHARSSANRQTLLDLLNDENSIIRAESARGLGDYADPLRTPEAVRALEQALNDPYPAVVIEAANSLARGQSETAEAPLLRILADAHQRTDGYDIAIRIAAMNALGFCAAPDSEKAVLALGGELAQREDMSLANAAVQALARLPHPMALPFLREHWDWIMLHKPKEEIAMQAWRNAVDLTRQALRAHGVDIAP